MKIHVLSDLHLEFAEFSFAPVTADLCVLAGDVSSSRDQVLALIAEIELYYPVIFVTGNHEYYPFKERWPDLTIREVDAWYREALATRFFQMDVCEVRGVRIAGCTLWSNFFDYDRNEVMAASIAIGDYSLLALDNRRPFSTSVAAEMHDRMRDFLSKVTADVVVTHHAPSRRSISPRFRDSHVNGAFVNDMESVIQSTGARLWIHGHTHAAMDYKIGNCRVICNPRGYQRAQGTCEETGFDPGFVVEI